MNVLFVYSVAEVQSLRRPLFSEHQQQLGISYISSLLKANGHSTRLAVLSRTLYRKNAVIVRRHIESFRPQLICFTAVASEYRFIASIAKHMKGRYPDIFLLVGGCHVSLNPEKILSDEFDALCIGEGEYPTLELVSQLEKGIRPSGVPNLWIKTGGTIEKNPTRPFLQDLDSLPYPDREMWQGLIARPSESEVLLGRGCSFECTYCCNHSLGKLASGPYVRLRSPDRIAEEVDAVASAHPVSRRVYLEVEMFGIDEQWALEVCSRLELLNRKRKSPLLFGTNFRVVAGADLERLFAACRRAHFEYVNIGLESGSEAIRREMLNRNYTNREFLECVKLAKAYGLKVHVNNLIGIPGESPEAARETIEVNRLCLPDQCRNSIFFPYPGTRLHAFCEERGLLRGVHPRDIEMERVRAALDLPGFPKRQIQKYFTWFEWHVYRGHRPTHKLLIRVLLLKIRSAPLLFLIYTKCRCSSAVNWTMDRLRRLVYDL